MENEKSVMVPTLMEPPVGGGKADLTQIVSFVLSARKGWVRCSHLRNVVLIAPSM